MVFATLVWGVAEITHSFLQTAVKNSSELGARVIRRKQRSPKTAEKAAQNLGSPLRKETQRLPETAEKAAKNLGSPLRKETQRLPETAEKTAQNTGSPLKENEIEEATTLDGRPRISTEPGVVPSDEEKRTRVRPGHLHQS